MRANDGLKRRISAILEATIDNTLLEGIAASAFLTDVDGADEVLAELFGDENPAEVRTRIDALRAEHHFGLGQVPAPPERQAALRTELAEQQLHGFLVPLADEHQGEFIAKRSQRLAWLTGFGGSAGMAIVLADKAAIFVDGRYTLQVRDQVDTNAFAPVAVAETSPDAWLRDNLPEGARLGFDPWLHTSSGTARLRVACTDSGAELVPVEQNPVDRVWEDQPPVPLGPVMSRAQEHAGVTSVEKRRQFSEGLAEAQCVASVLSAPDSIAWLLNIRGSDVPNSPLALGYATVHLSGDVDWFIDTRKIPASTRDNLDPGISIQPPEGFADGLAALVKSDGAVRVDPASAPEWIRLTLAAAGVSLSAGVDLCALPKARKNSVEVAGTRTAHIRDGAALTTFLAWLADAGPKGGVTEISAANHLYERRCTDARFRGLSFDTISGSGPNGAIVHYRVTQETDRSLTPGDVYLVDSGAQYLDGTTDVTRTVFIDDGKGASAQMKDHNTRVLKGHIAVATARFPSGTHGSQIDALARLALWEAGLDYDHGTGHGVGSYLGVHEGPQRISKQGGGVPMEPGMILSNEPGYYLEGAYGIRIENLVVVTESAGNATSERNMLEFETITLAPIDRNLIDRDLLTAAERDWFDAYHIRVRETLSPLVDEHVRKWLKTATAPI
ncbi:MAG: Xaa-Pro aminopeptidase [Paracoccaceae bacterium]